MQGKRVLVTGGNSGIGRAAAVELAQRGAFVFLHARDEARGEEALAEVKAVGEGALLLADFARLDDVRALAAKYLAEHGALDVLINNAGAVLSERQMTVDGHEKTWQANHLAPFLLTHLLLPRLLQSEHTARVVNVSSDAHKRAALDFDDLESARAYVGFQAYGRTKLMNIYFTRALASRMDASKLCVNALHPGVVATGFTHDGDTRGLLRLGWRLLEPFLRAPSRGAETLFYLASAPEVEGVTGKYFFDCEERRPSARALDDAAAERLWEASMQAVGLTLS